MTSIKSGWFTASLLAALTQTTQTGTPAAIKLTGQDADMNLALSGSGTTDYTVPVAYNSAAPGWTNAQEVTGTNWAAGGVLLSTADAGGPVTTTLVQGGSSGAYTLIYSWANPLSVASTTISSGIYGFQIYYPSITAGVANKPELLGIYVGTGYTTVAGTLTITPAVGGLSALTLTQ